MQTSAEHSAELRLTAVC